MADPENSQYLSEAVVFVGECLDMCPEFERYEREVQMGLDPLEKVLFYPFILPAHTKNESLSSTNRFLEQTASIMLGLSNDSEDPQLVTRNRYPAMSVRHMY